MLKHKDQIPREGREDCRPGAPAPQGRSLSSCGDATVLVPLEAETWLLIPQLTLTLRVP